MIKRILASVAVACCTGPAVAHAFLQHAEPGVGATLKAPPIRVALRFSERLEPAFSGVAITDSSGRTVEAALIVIRGNLMSAPLRLLQPGRYRVSWRVASTDGHRTEGAYSFTIKP